MRFLHALASIIHFPQPWRNAIVANYKRITRWKPPFFKRAREWGLNRDPRATKVTVSLTSYPGRIRAVRDTIDTLLTQTMKPDRVVLWLAEDQFPGRERDLPLKLVRQKKYGLEIEWCKDIKSFKKLLPALRMFPQDIIVTVDDDILYDPEMLDTLISSYVQKPDCVHSYLVMAMELDAKGAVKPYNEWKYNEDPNDTSFANLLMGGTGTLYPPGIMPEEVHNEAVFMVTAKTVDDMWFWAMAVYGGHKICHVAGGDSTKVVQNPYASNAAALWNTNMLADSGNDAQLAAILRRYPVVDERLMTALREVSNDGV